MKVIAVAVPTVMWKWPGIRATATARPAIAPLLETAAEAREIATVLGGKDDLFIGAQAQERSAKGGGLKDAHYVLFATHGFLGGDFLPVTGAGTAPAGGTAPTGSAARAGKKIPAQPALVLSLVGDLSGEDGLLTMKEVIEDVELDADLVALSACNTAGPSAEANNGEGFAGLTRAFMYAGARSLLVSHWSVDSLSTEALMTGTFRNIKGGATRWPRPARAPQLQKAVYDNGGLHLLARQSVFLGAVRLCGRLTRDRGPLTLAGC